ncbi:hypothetical protein K438DRAFT_1932818 [Mycena galopus ATCC 62051]|nr:hypothetical protein K438DRAFT_1932818 [Mycena galopus ATCC 62051]
MLGGYWMWPDAGAVAFWLNAPTRVTMSAFMATICCWVLLPRLLTMHKHRVWDIGGSFCSRTCGLEHESWICGNRIKKKVRSSLIWNCRIGASVAIDSTLFQTEVFGRDCLLPIVLRPRAEHVLANDFFLGEFCADFLDNARYLIGEAYCRTHQKIDIRDLSERLNLSPDEGEKWIVNLIRESRMGADAKIDLDKTVIDKTRGLHLRTSGLGTAISRMGVGAPQGGEGAAPTPAVAVR